MSAVDVLAVLDRAVKDAQDRVPFMPPEGTFDADHQFAYEEAGSAYMELREARAAVAELIEADLEYDAAWRDTTTTRRLQRREEAGLRRAAALANIGAAT